MSDLHDWIEEVAAIGGGGGVWRVKCYEVLGEVMRVRVS
jgi:hypothetical protein